MSEHGTCILCGLEVNIREDFNKGIYYVECNNCGNYHIKRNAFEDLPALLNRRYNDKKHLISGFLREMTELNLSPEVITNDNFENLFMNSKIPKTLMEKMDKLLSYIYRKTEILNQEIIIDITKPQSAIGYAKNMHELESMIYGLSELGYLKVEGRGMGGRVCVLSLPGFSRSEKLQKEVVNSKQGFVAMWFSQDMMNVFQEHISRAIRESGYDPFIIPMKEHNDDICDNIIAEIRKSKFLVADFTGQRGGVYFEAGFAYGLGLPVIWTCQESWFDVEIEKEVDVKIDGEMKQGLLKEKRVTHFDINHYNFIVWKDGEDLYNKLKSRIMATVI